jgi:putative FmdB family regulatory protein
MIYPYECRRCGETFEVIKSVRHIDDPEFCECGPQAYRTIAQRQSFSGEKDWDSAHYNHGLGQAVKSNAHASKLAKERGMIEIGDEPLDKIHKKFDTEREQKIESRYDEIFEPIEVNSRAK